MSFLFLLSAAVSAQEPSQEFQIEYSGSSDAVIVEYDVVSPMIKADDIPLLRIYGDGRVSVHRQLYVPDAGDYEMNLSEVELETLLRLLHEKGVLSFDSVRVDEELKIARAQRASAARTADQPVLYRSDVEQTVMRVRLEVYQASRTAPRHVNFDKEVRCVDVQHEAREHPQVESIRGIAEAAGALNALMTDPRLRKVHEGK